jgi:dUTP pyrophosphatase
MREYINIVEGISDAWFKTDSFQTYKRPAKEKYEIADTPGTIDSDYRGELKVILINLSNEPQVLSHGDRIAQMVISSVDKANLILVDEINSTQRGEGGFGHTGKK